MNPNHYLATAIQYLYAHREQWPAGPGVGKTLVSSAMIDRVAADLKRELVEVPVGFKWFVDGLAGGTLGFGGEESAGASFLRRDGSVWTTDKDGILLALLASEITAVTGRTPSEHYAALTARFGEPAYERIDAPATREEKARLAKLSPAQVTADTLAGEAVTGVLTEAPGNGASIGGIKVTTANAWFAARPSGTEDVYRSTPSPSRAPATSAGCRRRPGRWCCRHWAADRSRTVRLPPTARRGCDVGRGSHPGRVSRPACGRRRVSPLYRRVAGDGEARPDGADVAVGSSAGTSSDCCSTVSAGAWSALPAPGGQLGPGTQDQRDRGGRADDPADPARPGRPVQVPPRRALPTVVGVPQVTDGARGVGGLTLRAVARVRAGRLPPRRPLQGEGSTGAVARMARSLSVRNRCQTSSGTDGVLSLSSGVSPSGRCAVTSVRSSPVREPVEHTSAHSHQDPGQDHPTARNRRAGAGTRMSSSGPGTRFREGPRRGPERAHGHCIV
ncbi:hypothetical protein SHIRM173S_05918 [Streptomyces hirsutus]